MGGRGGELGGDSGNVVEQIGPALGGFAERDPALRIALNMQRPCVMLPSAASSCSFCSRSRSWAMRRSVMSSSVATQPPVLIG